AVTPDLRAERAASLAAGHALRESRKALNILVAEDKEGNQELVVDLLESRGHRVVVAGDGRAALDVFQKQKLDLVLMDVQMPVMGGFEAVAALREYEHRIKTHTPVIALTAHAVNGYREKCLAAGMDGYLTKPLDAGKLFAAIEGLAYSAGEELP